MFWTKVLIVLSICLSMLSCEPEYADYDRECPADWIYEADNIRSHMLSMPWQVSPDQQFFDIGDTLRFYCSTNDSVYDEAARRKWLFPNFPFQPLVTMWRVNDDMVTSGLRHVDWTVDSLDIETFVYQPTNLTSDQINFIYDDRPGIDDGYYFEIEIVPRDPGVYIFQAIDLINQSNNPNGEKGDYMARCLDILQSVYCRLQSPSDHLDDYDEELQLILEEVYGGSYKTTEELEGMRVILRREAAFAFEVR